MMESNSRPDPNQLQTLASQLGTQLRTAHQNGQNPSLELPLIQQLFALLTKEYVAQRRLLAEEPAYAETTPFSEDGQVTATDVAIIANDMLRAVDMDSFELNMWRALGRL